MCESRPDKLSDGETILYEIDMLRFSAKQLADKKIQNEERWASLETFLLHYRNLVDFLGHDDPRKGDDLHIRDKAFLDGKNVDQTALDKLHDKGRTLRMDVVTGAGIISKYLQHVTVKRTDKKAWPVGKMLADLEPLLGNVESMLSHVRRHWKPQPAVQMLDRMSASTASGSAASIRGTSPKR
jgi:hypothetical protein